MTFSKYEMQSNLSLLPSRRRQQEHDRMIRRLWGLTDPSTNMIHHEEEETMEGASIQTPPPTSPSTVKVALKVMERTMQLVSAENDLFGCVDTFEEEDGSSSSSCGMNEYLREKRRIQR